MDEYEFGSSIIRLSWSVTKNTLSYIGVKWLIVDIFV